MSLLLVLSSFGTSPLCRNENGALEAVSGASGGLQRWAPLVSRLPEVSSLASYLVYSFKCDVAFPINTTTAAVAGLLPLPTVQTSHDHRCLPCCTPSPYGQRWSRSRMTLENKADTPRVDKLIMGHRRDHWVVCTDPGTGRWCPVEKDEEESDRTVDKGTYTYACIPLHADAKDDGTTTEVEGGACRSAVSKGRVRPNRATFRPHALLV